MSFRENITNYQLLKILQYTYTLQKCSPFWMYVVGFGIYVPFDEQCSLFTMFYTLFGRYQWLRMPFGISSVLEVFHELIEGLCGIKVVACRWFCGNWVWEHTGRNKPGRSIAKVWAVEDQTKFKFSMRYVCTIYWAHSYKNGLCVDPYKVPAVLKICTTTQGYLAKNASWVLHNTYVSVLSQLSNLTKPLRELTQNDI